MYYYCIYNGDPNTRLIWFLNAKTRTGWHMVQLSDTIWILDKVSGIQIENYFYFISLPLREYFPTRFLTKLKKQITFFVPDYLCQSEFNLILSQTFVNVSWVPNTQKHFSHFLGLEKYP